MSAFKDYLRRLYTTDPTNLAKYASANIVYLRVARRMWRGVKRISSAKVTADDYAVDDESVTNPSWKLCPREMRKEFQALSDQTDITVERFCYGSQLTTGPDQEEGVSALSILTGGGRYAVDVGYWPMLQMRLAFIEEQWNAAADLWCSEEGYKRIHFLLEEERGKNTYEKIKEHIPDRHTLRTKFSYSVRRAPVVFIEDRNVPQDVEDGRRDELVELIDTAVRQPREQLAQAVQDVCDRLVVFDGVRLHALQATRVTRNGKTTESPRSVRGTTLTNLKEQLNNTQKIERYINSEFRYKIQLLNQELPDAPDAASEVAKKLNYDDAEAVRLGGIMRDLVAAARDESGMCAGFSAAVAR